MSMVLIAYDGSEHAKAAIARAGETLRHERAVVATAWTSFAESAPHLLLRDMVRPVVDDLDAAGREDAEAMAAEGADLARAAGFDAEPRAVEASGPFFTALLEAADAVDASVIVVGSRGRSTLAASVLGSVSTGILHHTRRPVLVVRGDE
jgi:nucleotide-binding universal stress UspA family protein